MSTTKNKMLKEGYERLRKALQNMINPDKERSHPQLALQRIRNKPRSKHIKNI